MPERDGGVRTSQRYTRHFGWAYAGLAELEGRASSFLAQGLSRGERLMYVADDPNVKRWPELFLERGDLVVLGTTEVYGSDRLVDPAAQRATFEAALVESLQEGYTGMRVLADNTSLVDGPLRLAAWLRWEDEAERFMAENPVIGLCAFDDTRIEPDVLHAVLGAHRVIAPPVP